MRRLLVLLILAVSSLGGTAVAEAMPPTVETMTVHRHFVFLDACGSFSVIADFDAERRITTFYDQDGNPIRQVLHAEIPGTITNSITGKSLPAFGVRVITIDLLTGAFSSTGTDVHVVVPGMGTVQLGAGRTAIDDNGEPFAAGRLDPPVTAALCEALAG
jgi:hypothetical protein